MEYANEYERKTFIINGAFKELKDNYIDISELGRTIKPNFVLLEFGVDETVYKYKIGEKIERSIVGTTRDFVLEDTLEKWLVNLVIKINDNNYIPEQMQLEIN
ncbi:MAG: hypothetical protein ACRCZK_01785 [Oscillospiraceae bacterium]